MGRGESLANYHGPYIFFKFLCVANDHEREIMLYGFRSILLIYLVLNYVCKLWLSKNVLEFGHMLLYVYMKTNLTFLSRRLSHNLEL